MCGCQLRTFTDSADSSTDLYYIIIGIQVVYFFRRNPLRKHYLFPA